MSLRTRVVMWDLLGNRVGAIPGHLSTTMTVLRNDASTLRLDFPSTSASPRAGLFATQKELALEVSYDEGNTWIEPPDARFFTQSTSQDVVKGAEEAYRIDAVHISYLLKEALVWDVPAAAQDSDGKYNFLSVNAGVILKTLWDRARLRGWGGPLRLNCTTSQDSAGRPWATVVTLAFASGVDLHTIVNSLINLGMIDVQWSGRTLNVYNADTTLAADKSAETIWHTGQADTAAPESTSWVDLATDILVKGEGGYALRIHNDQAPAGLRRVERVVEAGGVSTEATARLVASATLASGSEAARQITREWAADYAPLLPFRDYGVGDYITLEWPGGKKEKVRVAQISLSEDANGTRGDVTFGTRLDDVLSRLTKKTKGIVGAASTSGSGVRPTEVARVPKRTPATPLGLVVESDSYTAPGGQTRAVLTAGWAPVTTDTKGMTLEGVEYEVQVVQLQPVSQATQLFKTTVPSRAMEGFLAQQTYGVSVRAIYPGDATRSAWSPTVQVTPTGDVTPPEVPSAPAAVSNLGVLVITWDGLDWKGSPMAADFSHVEVSVTPPGGSAQAVTRTGQPSDRVIRVAGMPYGVYEVCLRAYDFTGNASGWGARATVTSTSLVDEEAIQAQLNAMMPQITEQVGAKSLVYQRAAAAIASGEIVISPIPPDNGVEGTSLWVGPDGKLWRMKTHY